jgi:hypothetical protein
MELNPSSTVCRFTDDRSLFGKFLLLHHVHIVICRTYFGVLPKPMSKITDLIMACMKRTKRIKLTAETFFMESQKSAGPGFVHPKVCDIEG